MMFKSLAIALLMGELNAAGGGGYNYVKNGLDWPDYKDPDGALNECGKRNQSPIDLPSRVSHDKIIPSGDDKFQKLYTNQVGDIEVGWTGDTTKVAVNKDGQKLQTFQSWWAWDWGGPDRWTGVQFHFHAGSEHTVDGKRHDIEMHTVHLPDYKRGDFNYAAMGIMFSVNDYTAKVSEREEKVIDDFFDSLQWEENTKNPKVPEVPYGDLMMMVDTDNRWVYRGSVTTPPCATIVYWNVVRKVYPIKQKHLDLYLAHLKRGKFDLATTGNYRAIQAYDDHDLHIIEGGYIGYFNSLSVAFGIMCAFTFLMFIVSTMLYRTYN